MSPPEQDPEQADAPVSNRPQPRITVDAAAGEGEAWALGEHAELGLETVAGWTGPTPAGAPAYLGESARADGRPPAIEGLLHDPEAYAAEAVIADDDRVQIRETAHFPWRAVCELRIETRLGLDFTGTGFFVAPRTVITAGHCVHLDRMGGWARRIEVVPGRDARDRPYSSVVSAEFRSVRGWTVEGRRSHDYGAIILPEGQGLAELGCFGLAVYDDASLAGTYLNLSGYPGDKPIGTQWWMARAGHRLEAGVIHYDIDTASGQSGAPVWRLGMDGRRHVVGIHTNGMRSGNSATRITERVLANLRSWIELGRDP